MASVQVRTAGRTAASVGATGARRDRCTRSSAGISPEEGMKGVRHTPSREILSGRRKGSQFNMLWGAPGALDELDARGRIARIVQPSERLDPAPGALAQPGRPFAPTAPRRKSPGRTAYGRVVGAPRGGWFGPRAAPVGRTGPARSARGARNARGARIAWGARAGPEARRNDGVAAFRGPRAVREASRGACAGGAPGARSRRGAFAPPRRSGRAMPRAPGRRG
jgi:hypothetical protein